MFRTKMLKQAYGPALTAKEAHNFLHKSIYNCYHFQDDIPRLPIPKLEDTVQKYLTSVSAQKTTIGEDAIKQSTHLAVAEKNDILQLHKRLVEYDSQNQHTSYFNQDWYDMYLSDRATIPFNTTPFMIAKRNPNENTNEITLRAANLVVSSLRLCLTLEKEILEPELVPILKEMPSGAKRSLNRRLVQFTPKLPHFTPPGQKLPVGLRTVLAYAILGSAPLDMVQYKHLFKSTRIPRKGMDETRKFVDSKHITVQCRGRFFKLEVIDKDGNIIDYSAIHKGIKQIWDQSKIMEYNQDGSVAYLSSWTRDNWASARQDLINTSADNAQHLHDIDSAILNIVLDDSLKEPLPDEEFDAETAKKATRTFLYGNGATRWWDKSFTWIVTEGGDAAINFEHSWGDGVAVMRLLNEVINENHQKPLVVNGDSAINSTPWKELQFNLNDKTLENIKEAKLNFDKLAQNMDNHGILVGGMGKAFLKQHSLGPDSVVQFLIQAAWKKVLGTTCPVYQSCSTSPFRGGRTENLRPCTVESQQAVDILLSKDPSKSELMRVIQASSKKHNEIKAAAQMGFGFDRHIYGMRKQAERDGVAIPDLFNDETFGYMNHFNLSTSTLDGSLILKGGGFGAVVPDGLGVGYWTTEDEMGCNVTAWKNSMKCSTSDFTCAWEESLMTLKSVLEQ